MATDIKLDQATNDLVATPSNDVMLVSGPALVEQRIRVRLKIPVGTWALDDTKTLGSSVLGLTRLSTAMAVAQLPLVVKEALAPMDDIRIDDVAAWVDDNDPKVVRFNISYAVVGTNGVAGDQLLFTDIVEVTQ